MTEETGDKVESNVTIATDNGKGEVSVSITDSNTEYTTAPSTTPETESNKPIGENDVLNNMDRESPPKTRRTSTTTDSIGSNNNISIVTLDENELESSVVDSDSDVEDTVNSSCDYKTNTSGIVLVNKNFDQPNVGQSSILCTTNNDANPRIGSIAVQNSSDITFGNKTFYQGPVTIKQFLYDKNKWKEADSTSSHDNPGFMNSTNDIHQNKNDTKDHPDEIKKTWKWTNKQAISVIIVAGTTVVALLALILMLKGGNGDASDSSRVGDGDDHRLNVPIPSTIGKDLIVSDTAGPLRIVSRGEWIAQPPANELTKLVLPSTRVVIAHTATENCTTQAECVFRVRQIQTYHMESRGWDDIGYNFLVGGDGAVYVGRAWDNQGAHTKGYNVKSICVAFIGTFTKEPPPQQQLRAAQKIIAEGVKLKKLSKDYKLYGHRQLMASESPGEALYKIIKTWDHWSDTIDPV